MGTAEHLPGLTAVAQAAGVPATILTDTPLGLVVHLLCDHPQALAAYEAEAALPRVRKFVCWQMPTVDRACLSNETAMATFARTIEAWLHEHHHGSGSRCLPIHRLPSNS